MSEREFTFLTCTIGRSKGVIMNCCACEKVGAIREMYGYCADCWKNLSPTERAVLRGEEPPVEKVVHHVRMMPVPRWSMVAQWIYNVACGAVVAWLYWRLRR